MIHDYLQLSTHTHTHTDTHFVHENVLGCCEKAVETRKRQRKGRPVRALIQSPIRHKPKHKEHLVGGHFCWQWRGPLNRSGLVLSV